MSMVQGENYDKLLGHLKAADAKSIDSKILLPPSRRTRPGVGLIASYDKVWQGMWLAVPWGVLVVGAGATWLGCWSLLLNTLDSLVSIGSVTPDDARIIWSIATSWWGSGTMSGLIGIIAPFGVSYVRGKLSRTRDDLALDLNGMHHEAPQGRVYTPWAKVITGHPARRKQIIKLLLDDGSMLWFRVPYPSDCGPLWKVIQLLVQHHQPDGLLGKQAERGPKVNV